MSIETIWSELNDMADRANARADNRLSGDYRVGWESITPNPKPYADINAQIELLWKQRDDIVEVAYGDNGRGYQTDGELAEMAEIEEQIERLELELAAMHGGAG